MKIAFLEVGLRVCASVNRITLKQIKAEVQIYILDLYQMAKEKVKIF